MNRVYKLVWNRARNMYIAVSEIAKSHRKETLRGGRKSAVIFLVALYLFGTGFAANTVQAENNSPVLTDEQKNEIVDKVLEKLNNNENLSKKIQDEVFKYKNKLIFAGGVIGKQNSPSDTPMAFGNGAFANGSDGISLGYQADAFSTKAVSIGARASTLWNGDVAVGNQTHVAGLSAALGSGTQLYANQSVALGTQITIVDPEVLELYKKYNYTNPDNKGAVDVPSWYWREQIIKNTPEIQDFKKRYARFLGTLDQDGLDPTYHDELYKQKLIETILWEKTTKKIQKVTAVGFQSGVKVTGGVALGAFSNATRKGEVIGYNPNGEQYQNVADFLVRNNKKEAYVKALQEQETLEKEVSDLEKQRKSLSGEKYREISEQAYEKNKESKKASKKVNDLYNAWVSVQGAVAVGNEETGMTRQITGVAAGSEDTDAVNVAQLKALNNKIEQNKTNPVKYISINSGNKEKKPADDSDNSKNDGAYGANSIAIGRSAKAAGQSSMALGFQSKAWDEASLSIGRGATAFNRSALAIGHESTALNIRGTAVGYYAVAGRSSTAVGPNGQALGIASVALGEGSYVGDSSFRETYKKRSNVPYYYINEVIAKDTEKWENYKKKFKEELKDLSEADAKEKLIALIMSDLNKEVKFSTAIGNQSIVGVSFGTALGYGSQVNSEKAVALGADSLAERSGNPVGYVLGEVNSTLDEAITSVGLKDKYDDLKEKTDSDLPTYNELKKRYKEAVKPDDEKQALKDLKNWEKTHEEFLKNLNERKNFEGTWKGSSGVVSVGNKKTGMTRQITGVAAGSEDTDVVNVAQLKALNTKVDNNRKAMEKSGQNGSVKYFSVNPDNNKRTKPAKGSDNSKNDGAYGENSVAIGAFAEAADKNTLALGWSVKALGMDSLALGTMVYSYGRNSNAVGNQAAALGEESSAFGNQAKAMDMGTTALGNNAMAIQNGSTAVGYQSLSTVSSTSMGTNSFALGQASLALGQQSYIGDTTFRDTYTKYNEEKGNDNNIPGFYISDLINKNDPKIAKYKEQFKNQLQGLDGHNQEAVLRYLIIADLNKSVQFATAVGNHSTVGASQGTALGFYSTVTGAYGTALGYNSVSTDYGAMAAGAYAKASTVGSVAIGFKSKVDNYGGVAIGSEATVGKNGGVALGNKSTADRGSGVVGYVLGADNSILTKVLEAPGNKARFEELKMKIKDEDVSAYNALVMTFKNAAKDSPEKEKAKQEIEKWKAAHPDFLKNVKARKNFENAWQSTYEAVSVGDVEKGITRQITGVAAGSEDTDAVNVAQLKAANSKIENNIKSITNLTTKVEKGGIKYFSVNPKTENLSTANISSDNSANDGATGLESMAIGKGARAAGQQSIVIGQDAVSEHHGGSIVIGQNAKASGDSEWHGVVVGSRAEVTGGSGVALGNDSKVTAGGGIALGFGSLADREWNVLGYTPDRNANSLQDRLAGTEYDELVKKLAPLITEHNQLVDDFNHENNPIKKKEKHEKYEAWKAAHPDYDADVKKRDMLKSAWKSGSGAVSVGNSALKATRQIIGVAAGSEDTDAVNVAQLKALNKKVDTNTEKINNLNLKVGKGGVHYFSVKADDSGRPAGTNYDNDGATGDFAIAAGYSSVAAGANSIAVGFQAKSPGSSGVAVGNKASANNTSDIAMGINAESSGSWGVAIGGYSQAKGVSGIALGQQAKAESQSGIAIGVQSEATGIWGVAIGQNAKAQASTSVAIACRAEAQNENSVAIGNLAKAIGATSTVIGAQATASGTWGTSVGFFAEANSENGTAIGVSSKARAKKGIALGAYSVADREGKRIGYSLGGDNSTIDNVLESVGLTEKYNQLESVVNPLKDEYKSLVGAFQKAAGGSAEKAAAKEKLKKWEIEHPDFMSASTEIKKILTSWKSNSGALSIGNEEYGITRQIIGVAAGSEDTDAVNVAQLKALATAPMGFDVSGKVENNVYTPGAKNWTMPLNGLRMSFGDGLRAEEVTDKDGKKYTLVKMNDEISIGKAGENGKDGKIGLNGKDGHSAEITVGKGKDGVDGTNGENGNTRIIYKDQGNQSHEVATLDDGLKFKGDNNDVVIRKLNTQLNIKGGITDENLVTTGNIGVFGKQDGGLAVKLSKNLKGLTSAEFKDGDNITNITGGNISITKKVNNQNETKNIDLWNLSTTVNNFKGGFTIKDAVSGTVDVALGETTKPTITFKAETKNTEGATSALTATVDTNKNVTYTLNTKKLKEEMGLNNLGTGTMSSWKLKVGTESTDISNGNEVTFAASTDEAAKGLSVKKEGNVITYGINKSEFVGNIAGDIITEINKTTNTTKITNVDWSKFPGMNFYTQGSVNNGVYTPGASVDNKWSSSHIVFGDGIKVEKLKDKDNNQVTRISLDGTGGTGKNGKDGKSAYEIWRDHEENGNQPNKDKTEKQFLESLKGKDGKDGEKGKDGVNGTKGTDGKDGTNGKSAYEIWKSKSGNENKTEDEFLASLKGKDGKDGEKGKDGANGKDGKDGTIADIQGDDKSGVSVKSITEVSKKTYTIGLGTKIKAGEVTIDGTKDKENAVVGDVKINGEKGNGMITGLSNKRWDVNEIVSGRAATEDQLQQATQNM
ncbi:Hep/Hag repeat protein, partial [Veillonellaceae bacterium DNF00626]